MKRYKKHILPVQTGIIVGILVTAILFMGLPLLSSMQRAHKEREKGTRVLITNTEPPPPPEPEKEKL
jgi:hypothetical protein